MAGNGPGGDGSGSGRGGAGTGASISAAAAAMGSVESRFPLPERRRRWGGCFGGLSCFGSQGRAKRVVPSSTRVVEGNGPRNRGNGPQAPAPSIQTAAIAPSLLAPPSSPASFTHSAVPSTAQSPSCFLSISGSSPGGGPSATMFATGPYAHETQLVSPPVFSTFTTEPSTAPLTPPPELAHLTTPSSPDVPYARFLSSSLAAAGKGAAGSDLQATYPLYPGSPSSSLISPASATPRTGLSSPFPEREVPTQSSSSSGASPFYGSQSSRLFGHRNFMMSPDSGLFCAAASAQFYLDQAQHPSYQPHSAARLSVSREADVYSSGGGGGGGGHRHSKACKQEEEIEAYRASFGFSADELIITQNYVEISDVAADDSFSMAPEPAKITAGRSPDAVRSSDRPDPQSSDLRAPCDPKRTGLPQQGRHHSGEAPAEGLARAATDDESASAAWGKRASRSFRMVTSVSDAEVDYRRSSSARETLGGAHASRRK